MTKEWCRSRPRLIKLFLLQQAEQALHNQRNEFPLEDEVLAEEENVEMTREASLEDETIIAENIGTKIEVEVGSIEIGRQDVLQEENILQGEPLKTEEEKVSGNLPNQPKRGLWKKEEGWKNHQLGKRLRR